MASKSLTTIHVHSDVAHRLRALKAADQTWSEFLTAMSEDYTPPGGNAEIEPRRPQGGDVSGPAVIRRSRELSARGR